jgi:hypothetical protein
MRDSVPPRVISTYEATSRISKPTYRLNRSPAMNALKMPADRIR